MFVGCEVDLRVRSVESTGRIFTSVHHVFAGLFENFSFLGVSLNTRHCVMENNVVYHSPFVVIDRVRKRYLSCCSVFETSCEASANHILGFPVRHFKSFNINLS